MGVNIVEDDIELDEDPFDSDNEFTQKVNINVERGKEGSYPITINSYILRDILWDSDTVHLNVDPCTDVVEEPAVEEPEEVEEEPLEEEETIEEETVETAPETEEDTESIQAPILSPTTSTESSLTSSPGFWILVIFFNLVIIGLVVFLILKPAGKK